MHGDVNRRAKRNQSVGARYAAAAEISCGPSEALWGHVASKSPQRFLFPLLFWRFGWLVRARASSANTQSTTPLVAAHSLPEKSWP